MNAKLVSELIIIVISITFFLVVVLTIVFTVGIRYRKRKKENEDMKVLFEAQLLQSRVEMQEQTLQHVSREIHDNLGQVASLIKINLNTIRPDNIEKTTTKIDDTKELVRRLITDLKLLSTSLNADKVAQNGLVPAIERELELVNKTGHMQASLDVEGSMPVIDPNKVIITYRMFQEILNNALKHADASLFTVHIQVTSAQLILTMKDNGKGYDVDSMLQANSEAGNGLINLQNRAKVMDGILQMKSEPGKGTETTLTIPLT